MYNKVFLIGNIAAETDVRASASGTFVATTRLATNVYAGKSDDGTRKEQTDFHQIVLFGKQAEFAGNYLNKGRQVFIEGRLHTSSWDDAASGTKKYRTEVIVEEVKLLGSRPQEAAA